MSRPLRIEFPGATYHVMARGVARMPIVRDDKDRRFLIRLLKDAVEGGRLSIHAFCLMINHLHLLTQTPQARLHRWMQVILSRYATHYNARRGREGHLFQGRYKALVVESGQYFANCSRYIHRNPNELVGSLAEYRWSSYPTYLKQQPKYDWVSQERTIKFFGSREAYLEFVRSDAPVVDPFEKAIAGTVFGSDEFVATMRRLVLAREEGSEVDVLGLRALRLWGNRPSVAFVGKVVDLLFSAWPRHRRRWLSVYLLRERFWMKNRDVAERLRITPQTATSAYWRIRRMLEADRDLQLQMTHLFHQLPEPRN